VQIVANSLDVTSPIPRAAVVNPRCIDSERFSIHPNHRAVGNSTPTCQACPLEGFVICGGSQLHDAVKSDSFATMTGYLDRSTLFEQDAVENYIHVVDSGMVRLFQLLPDGRRLVLGFALPGEFLGLSMAHRHAYSAEALGDVATCKIERSSFSRLLDLKPLLLRRFHEETARELTVAQERMMLLGRCTARERTAIFLLTMRRRWQRINGQSTNISLPMTRQDIGDYVGVTIETVSRMLSAFCQEKILMLVPGGVRILNLAALQATTAGLSVEVATTAVSSQ
jgi:CRP/FNR family transcriptional regulator, anaerobic regulatory protein